MANIAIAAATFTALGLAGMALALWLSHPVDEFDDRNDWEGFL